MVLILALGGLVAYLVIDLRQLQKARSSIDILIHVNGIRGKTTVVRMLDGIFRQAGYKTFSKVTGTLPEVCGVDGQRRPIVRRRGARIGEPAKIIRQAASEGAQVLILECMAVKPLYQGKSAQMIQADYVLINNVRLDHGEDMGLSRQAIAESLAEVIVKPLSGFGKPIHPTILVGDTPHRKVFMQKANDLALDWRLVESEPLVPEAVSHEHPDNVAMAMALADHLGIDRDLALTGLSKRVGNPRQTDVVAFGGGHCAFGMTINDLDSTESFYRKHVGGQSNETTTLLFNDRADRPVRSGLFLHWMVTKPVGRIYLAGDRTRWNRRRLRKLGYRGEITLVQTVEDIDFKGTQVIAVGNVQGFGHVLWEALHA